MTLIEYLKEKNQNNSNFTIAQLNKLFPQEKETIKKYKFLGLIEPVSNAQITLMRSKVV